MYEERVKMFLGMFGYKFCGNGTAEKIKNICIAKMCEVIGVDFKLCLNSKLFQIFGSILGEAVCVRLMLDIHVANEKLRCAVLAGVNIVEQTLYYLKHFDVDEAVLDAFNYLDEHKTFLLEI